MSAGDIHSILYRGEDPLQAKFKPKAHQLKKVQRYWPGKAPGYAPNADEELELSGDEVTKVEGVELQDKRLLRLTETERIREYRSNKSRDRSTIDHSASEAQVKEEADSDEEEKEDAEPELEDSVEERRRRLREIRLHKLKDEEQQTAQQYVKEDIEEESVESEYESDYEDPSAHTLLKPIFVPKEKRDTIKEKIELENEETLRQEAVRQKLKLHKAESQKLLVDMIKTGSTETAPMLSDVLDASDHEMEDDEEEANEAEEYELWKVREMKRIQRDKDELEARKKLLAEVERRRQMTEEERRMDDKKMDEKVPRMEKKYKQLFMQKYYHKGAFFQDKAQAGEEEIYLRDFHAPVGEDMMNKKILPKAMRLRRGQFGRAGQVKHTHLVDVDTTDFSTPWAMNDAIRYKDQSRMAGVKGDNSFDRPKAKGK